MAPSDLNRRVNLAALWTRLLLLEIYPDAAASPLAATQVRALLEEVDRLLAAAESDGGNREAV